MSEGRTGILWAAIALSIGCVVPIFGMPIIVEGLEDHWHLSQAGYITSLDLAGLVLGSSLTSSVALRIHWRHYLTAALSIAVLLNLACTLHPGPLLLGILRLGAGLASSCGYAASLTLLSRLPDNARGFSWMIFAQVVANALILSVFPALDDTFGPAGMFAATALILALTLGVAPLMPGHLPLPPRSPPAARASVHSASTRALAGLCLSAIVFVYIAIGSYWAYAERMGVSAGLSATAVHRLLTAGVLLSGLGCFAAFRLGRRHGQSRPLLGALAALAAVLMAAGVWQTPSMYVFALATLQLCWNFIDIYQLGTLSVVDPTGRSAALVPAAQGVALAIGPAAANFTLGAGGRYATVLLMAAASAAMGVLCYSLVHALHERNLRHALKR